MYPGMPFYNMNAPPPTSLAPIAAPAPTITLAPNAVTKASQYYILSPSVYNNSYAINAVRFNGDVLTANYSLYVPGENLTISLGINWYNLLKAEAVIEVNETGVSGGKYQRVYYPSQYS